MVLIFLLILSFYLIFRYFCLDLGNNDDVDDDSGIDYYDIKYNFLKILLGKKLRFE